MSTRERWIVYPLLFLTLGIAMRDKIVPPKHVQVEELAAVQIRCNQLQVAQLASASRFAAPTIQCAELAVTGPNGRPTIILITDPRTKGGLVETFSATGAPQVVLQPIETGGAVLSFDSRRRGATASPEKPKTPPASQPSKETEQAPPKVNP